jgi:hypothetical protein
MKTTFYNAEKEIRIAILVAVFAISIFTAVRANELQLNETTDSAEAISTQILTNGTNLISLPIYEARLIEESVPVIETLIKNTQYKAADFVKAEIALEGEKFLGSNSRSEEAEPLMPVYEYKAADFVNAEMDKASEIFFNSNSETTEAEPLMTKIDYKAADFVNAQMAQESERFQNSNTQTEESEAVLTVEPLTFNYKYKAADFIEPEMAMETQRWNENESVEMPDFTPNIEVQTAQK